MICSVEAGHQGSKGGGVKEKGKMNVINTEVVGRSMTPVRIKMSSPVTPGDHK